MLKVGLFIRSALNDHMCMKVLLTCLVAALLRGLVRLRDYLLCRTSILWPPWQSDEATY